MPTAIDLLCEPAISAKTDCVVVLDQAIYAKSTEIYGQRKKNSIEFFPYSLQFSGYAWNEIFRCRISEYTDKE